MIKQYKNLILLVVGTVVLLLLVFNTYRIPVGYTGVLVRFGRIEDTPVQSGTLHFTVPFAESIAKVNNRQQDFTLSLIRYGARRATEYEHTLGTSR